MLIQILFLLILTNILSTKIPTSKPTISPSCQPTKFPTTKPTVAPTDPTSKPTSKSTTVPTSKSTIAPTTPTSKPTVIPSSLPTSKPTIAPTVPTSKPTAISTTVPTLKPTITPTVPTSKPTSHLTIRPSIKPTIVKTNCKLKAYENWKLIVYTGLLVADPTFWRYQTQPQLVLTNYLALELAIQECSRQFDSLTLYLAGRMGPVHIQDAYKIMCRSYCLEVDNLIEEAMSVSECSCLELSTQKEDISYHIEGDFCTYNSARMLCNKLGYCGIWNCRIDDFMCPRYEWNKMIIEFKGPGTCVRGQGLGNTATKNTFSTIHLSIIIIFVVVLISNIIMF